MELMRYIVEIKDEYGWCDHSTLTNRDDAIRIGRELMESFEVKVIDKLNMLEIDICNNS